MPSDTRTRLTPCNCLALRQAARHVTQYYDQCLAPTGLRTTQFSILAKLKRLGPMTINALAADLVMDRTTLGRTMLPLERDGLIAVRGATADRRSKELHRPKPVPSGFVPHSRIGPTRRRASRRRSAAGVRQNCGTSCALLLRVRLVRHQRLPR